MMNPIIKEDMEFIATSGVDWTRFKNKTILVTGATGMLASYFCMSLLYADMKFDLHIKLIALVRNKVKASVVFEDFIAHKNLKIIEKDVSLFSKKDIKEKIDFIIHAASLASSQYYGIDPVGTLLPNVVGSYNMLEIARIADTESFLFFSSGEVYGKIENKTLVFESDMGIVDPMDVRSCYAESKRMGENMCKSWTHQYNISTKIARICHTYGPTMNIKNDQRVFAEFVKNIVCSEDIEMKSDGSPIRSFCYINDAIIAFYKILLDGKSGEAYNVVNNKSCISMRELAELLVSLYPEKSLKVIAARRVNDVTYLENKSNNTFRFSTEKLESLGWTPIFSLEDGFKRTIASFTYK